MAQSSAGEQVQEEFEISFLLPAAGVSYTYDGDGRRVKKSNGKLYWFGLGGAMLAETDLSGNNPTEHIYFGGSRVARRDPSGTVYYSFADHLGTTRIITDPAGAIKQVARTSALEVRGSWGQRNPILDSYRWTLKAELNFRKSGFGKGFSLLEMMAVAAMILILASFAIPTYQNITLRAREAVLRDDLFTMRAIPLGAGPLYTR